MTFVDATDVNGQGTLVTMAEKEMTPTFGRKPDRKTCPRPETAARRTLRRTCVSSFIDWLINLATIGEALAKLLQKGYDADCKDRTL